MFLHSSAARRYLAFARQIRYRTLQAAVGVAVRIHSEATVLRDVLQALEDVLPRGLKPAREPTSGLPTVAKYALLDLEFVAPEREAARLRRLSMKQLRELGILSGALATKSSLQAGEEEAQTCIDQMLEEISDVHPVLKLMLDAAHDSRSKQQRILDSRQKTPGSYFPTTFIVRDCCITNAPSLWLEKHFYL
jgi:hypothetical protein